jgi:GT2 family glycosyltransferase
LSKLIAAIPVKNNIKWTAPAVEHLLLADEVDEVWLYDNGSTDMTKQWALSRQKLDSRLKIFDMGGVKLYDMWSHMIKTASHTDNAKLAILNNDIRLPHNAIKTVAERMTGHQIACIDRTVRGSEPIENLPVAPAWWGEKTGWAFVLDVDFWKDEPTPIDPVFRIWWGDDDLFRRAQVRGGKICIVKGVGCDHFEWSSDSEYPGDKWVDVEADRLDFIRIWGN